MKQVIIIEGHRPSLMPHGPDVEQAVLGNETRIFNFGAIEKASPDLFAKADAVIVRPGTPFGRERIDSLKQCRVLVSLGIGYDHIDLETAKKRGIPVCNVPDYGVEEVADTALAMTLYLHRRIGFFHRESHEGPLQWDWRLFRPIQRTRETKMGIIGLGRIGTSVALKAKGIGYSVQFFDPYLSRGIEKSVGLHRLFDLKTLLQTSDIVTIHTPLTAETRQMIDEAFIGNMKENAILINVSRGGILKNLDVVMDALKKRPQFAIGIDVLPEEPPPPHPLLDSWQKNETWISGRFLLTPHAAFYSEEACLELRRKSAEVVRQVLDGGMPYNLLNE